MPKRKRIKHRGGAPKSYLRRLPRAIVELTRVKANAPIKWIDSHWISDHLDVSKATAIRILNAAGAERAGNALLITSEKLLMYFHGLYHDPYTAPEIRRQSRTAKQLTDMARYMSQRQVVIPDPSGLAKTLFRKLLKTPGIYFNPASLLPTKNSLLIEFVGFEDFLRKFGMVVYALQNDFDEMRQYLSRD